MRYLVRGRTRGHSDNLVEYLRSRRGGAAVVPSLCYAVESYFANGSVEHRDDPIRGFPWLTPVLGSGCLELVDRDWLTDALGDAVDEALRGRWLPDGSEDQATSARAFARSLVTSRLPPTTLGAETVVASIEVSDLACEMTLIGALLTRFYHRVRAAGPEAMSRRGDDAAAFDPQLGVFELRDLDRTVLEPLRNLVTAVARRFRANEHPKLSPTVQQAIATLLERLRTQLEGRPRIHIQQVRLVTEVAWYILTLQPTLYPGWADLLLQLMLGDDAAQPDTARERPQFSDLQLLPAAIRHLFLAPTHESWEEFDPDTKPAGRERRLHKSTARLLWNEWRVLEYWRATRASAEDSSRQALELERRARDLLDDDPDDPEGRTDQERASMLRQQATKLRMSVPAPPPAVAFVTSFDVELPMALWTTAPNRSPFSIVMPVHVLQGSDPTAELCWLMADVHPTNQGSWSDRLHEIIGPDEPAVDGDAAEDDGSGPRGWRLLGSGSGEPDLRSKPIVVFLNGCPLVRLPDLRSEAATRLREQLPAAGVSIGPSTTLEHAATVDEYLAISQSATELVSMMSLDGVSRALPPDLTQDGDDNPRFWLAMGVPVGDPAVRHRVVSQINAQTVRDGIGAPPPRKGTREEDAAGSEASSVEAVVQTVKDVAGVAVNLRIGEEDANLLFWLGLDVVTDNCGLLAEHIERFARHMGSDGVVGRRVVARTCTICLEEGSHT